jgi:hypothetical protein
LNLQERGKFESAQGGTQVPEITTQTNCAKSWLSQFGRVLELIAGRGFGRGKEGREK